MRYTSGMEVLLDEPTQTSAGDAQLFAKVTKSEAYFAKKTRAQDGRAAGQGQFNLVVDIIALQGAVYIPLSIASGKKPTGFIYHIEGSAQGALATAKITCKGEGVAQLTLGTLVYAKIPQGKTATFKMVVHIKGSPGKLYKVVINRINYKLDPSAARYKKLDTAIATKTLKFK